MHEAGMKLDKKAFFIAVVVVLAVVFALPATRDELDWRWTASHDQAADYMQYFTDWPKGRHVAEAHTRYENRTWVDTKKALISEAIKKHKAADPNARKERKERMERFFWKEVTNENTVVSYNDYLQRYPTGQFAALARRQIDDLNRKGAAGNDGNSSGP